MIPLVEARGLGKAFGSGPTALHAVSDIDLAIVKGETLGIVGESGCGKSTLGRLLLCLIEPTSGTVWLDGQELTTLAPRAMRGLRRRMQMVFQDPYSSLDPRVRIGRTLEEPFRIQGVREQNGKAAALLETVGMSATMVTVYPHQLSGGQRQRVSIARALALSPDFIVLDEPTASLDVSVQAQIVQLLETLRASLGLTYAFISHNLPLVDYLSDRVAVLYLGRIVELLPSPATTPRHHYTRALRASAFEPDPRLRRAFVRDIGDVPSPFDMPPGCSYASRCPAATDICRAVRPGLVEHEPGHSFACHHPWSSS